MSPMSEGQKETLAVRALGLLNEQVQARIVHYKGERETSPELDAITAQVVAELKAMQAAAGQELAQQQSPEQREEQQRRAFSALLGRVFSPQSQYSARILKPIGRRIAKLFFESELHEKTKGDKCSPITSPLSARSGNNCSCSRWFSSAGDELLERLSQSNEDVRGETVKFFTDPHIFSETCAVMCQELYDFLCLEGFLDLPVDWRVSAE
ncbi:MAG TPA: hypothetical protein VHW01_03695, partial [Polyangiaceae bacterium]|nr:hypothetical protein [Polyangiaceae bacterium]